ncbi:hypothetical protein HZH68_003751 [Vespula germanica]|uniref:Uncharacterized protein n=1 Tax=Vespula germanica TaxID=30212 RepID=A0A834NPS3_VESGE|nr:hypothetical protein HZH68_003751 [Vespula germanica]
MFQLEQSSVYFHAVVRDSATAAAPTPAAKATTTTILFLFLRSLSSSLCNSTGRSHVESTSRPRRSGFSRSKKRPNIGLPHLAP